MHQHLLLRYLASLFWLTVSLAVTREALAQIPASSSELRLGKPATAAPVSLSESADGSVLSVGNAQATLPLRQARTVRSENVPLAGGTSVGVIRASDGTHEAAAVAVRRANGSVDILWTGALFLRGDPGERRADAIEVADRDGDRHPDLIVGAYDERVRVCGQDKALLEPRALDPKTLALRPVLLNRIDPKRPVETLAATPKGLETQGPPLLRALRPAGSSSYAAGSAGADLRAATDGDLATFWAEGRGLGGRFEFLTLRWGAPEKPIKALALVLPAAPSGTVGFSTPKRISISGDQGPRLEVNMPAGIAPGQRYWIVPKQPITSSCLTISLDDVGASGPQVHGAIAEVEAYTDLDQGGGAQALVDELIHDGPRAADATEWLMQSPLDVVSQLSAAWPGLSVTAKRRALRVAAARAATDDAALALVAVATRDTDAEVARAGLNALVQQLPRSQQFLLDAARNPGRSGDEAALALARAGAPSTLRDLLKLWAGEPRAAERAEFRDAVAMAYRRAGNGAATAVDQWVQEDAPSVQARAAASLALASVPEGKASAARLLESSVTLAAEFPERWRLVLAAAQLPAEPKTDAWLANVVASADEWMLRSAALDALEQRQTPAALPAAKAALSDAYPRVRARALHVLANDRESIDVLVTHARKDEWFLVRAAALAVLPDGSSGRAAMLDGLYDHSPVVRAAAIRALRRVHAADAWKKIEPIVLNAEEYPDVIGEGVGFARALCVEAAAESLQDVVKRGLRPNAWTADQELAFGALEALTHLGGANAKWALQRSAAPNVPATIRTAAARAVNQLATCRPE
jgi:HEAT repeat protein